MLLISPPVLHGENWWANRIANKPHLASLAGVVRDLASVRTLELDRIADADLARPLAEVERAVASIGAQRIGLVGLSCWTSLHYLGTLAVARRIRELLPDVPIAIGGHHATALPQDFDHASCDFLVRGDGELPMRALCLKWPARPKAMQILEGGAFDQSDPSHIDWDDYGPDEQGGALWVGSSRGCAFKCHFCVEPERGASYSRYEVSAQLDILERLVERRAPRVIAFSDPLFGANRKWLEAFLDGVERRALPLMFWCETRVDLMSKELLERFQRCRFLVDFGLDTASEEMARRMEKAAQPQRYLERARELFDHANQIGLPHGIYIVFNFPGETPETMRETQVWLEAIAARPGPLSGWLSCQTFFILPGTQSWFDLAKNAERYGTEIAHPTWWREPGDHRTLATAVIPSAAFRGRESELLSFWPWNQAINAAWSLRHPPAVTAFRQQFYAG